MANQSYNPYTGTSTTSPNSSKGSGSTNASTDHSNSSIGNSGVGDAGNGIVPGTHGTAGNSTTNGYGTSGNTNPDYVTPSTSNGAGYEGTSGAGKIISKADDVIFNGSSVDKAFAKHGKDFRKYPDGSKTSVNAFTNDVKDLINNGTQVKGTYRTTAGTHIYNPSTKQWVFINKDGTFNTAFKLSDSQYKYLIETGVIK